MDSKEMIMGVDLATGADQTSVIPQEAPTNDSLSPIQLLDMHKQMQDMKDMKNQIVAEQSKLLDNDELVKHLESILEPMVLENVKKLTDEQVREIYFYNGEPVELTIDIPAEKQLAFKKDYLIHMKETAVAVSQIDEAIEKLETDLATHDDELKQLLAEYGDVSTMIRSNLQNDYDGADDEKSKKTYQTMLAAFDDALNLTRIYNECAKHSIKNTLFDYSSDSQARSLYTRFMQAIKNLKLKSDLTAFNNLELEFLPEKYHKYPNLFLFSVIKIMAHKRNNIKRIDDGIFLTQLVVNLQNLYTNKFKNEETKQTFIAGITKTLDLFYPAEEIQTAN